jgi:hypothetical protein
LDAIWQCRTAETRRASRSDQRSTPPPRGFNTEISSLSFPWVTVLSVMRKRKVSAVIKYERGLLGGEVTPELIV